MMRMRWLGVAVLGVLAMGAVAADETAQSGRAVMDAARPAVITVKAVISFSDGQEENENKNEGNATVISPDGLAVLALSAVDPTALIESFRDMSEGFSTKLNSLKMLAADGREIDAEVVLRDKDLDLAFIRPTAKPEQPFPFVNLETAGQPEMFDPVVVVGQLGAVAQRTHIGFLDRVEGVVEKPRRFYILGEHRARQVVCSPVFTLDNRFVGIGAFRAVNSGDDDSGENILAIVVPCDQIKELVAQVPARAE